MVPRGGTAIDVGANLGFFAYAFSNIADWVVAFEPNPDYAFFARWMLRGRAEVHQLALSDGSGQGTLYVPGRQSPGAKDAPGVSQRHRIGVAR